MIIVKFWGGIGNQMFQYALYKALKQQGKNVYADCTFYDKKYDSREFCLDLIFPNIKMDIIDEKTLFEFWHKYTNRTLFRKIEDRLWPTRGMMYIERKEGEFDRKIFDMDNIMLEGYWQTEKYFENLKEILEFEFMFNLSEKKLLNMEKKINSEECAVSVHIRRGDYIEKKLVYGNICTDDYYKNSINQMCDWYNNAKFYIFSDDTEWAKKLYLEEKYEVIESKQFNGYKDWYDLYLMSLCDHNIIANSSFSWWGAWLNRNLNKKVIAPKKWMNTRKTNDIWCEGWYKI